MKAAILLIASFIGVFPTQAQTWRLVESTTTLKGPQHEMLPRPGGEILTITHPLPGHKGPMIFTRFDARLNELYTRRVDLLSHEQYQAAWYAGSRLFLFTTDRLGGLTRYEIDDQSGGLIGTPLPLTGLPQKAAYYSGGSTSSNCHYLAAATSTTIHGILYDAQGEKITVFQYTGATQHPTFLQSTAGDLSIILGQATIVHITVDGSCKASPLAELPNVQNLSWSVHNQTLYFSALQPQTGNNGLTEILTGSVDPETGMVSNLKQTAVAALLASIPQQSAAATRPTSGPTQSASPAAQALPENLALLRELPLTDGSRLVLFENGGHRLYQNHWSSAMQNPAAALARTGAGGFTAISPGAQGESYLSRGDVYVLKIDAANTPQWLNILSKDQEESEKLTAIGAGCLVDASNNLHVFFYDSRNNTDVWKANPIPVRADDPHNNALACISITPDGAVKKQFIALTDTHYRLMPEIACVDNKDQACFLAVRAKLCFSNELAFDRAGYKLGVISIQ